LHPAVNEPAGDAQDACSQSAGRNNFDTDTSVYHFK